MKRFGTDGQANHHGRTDGYRGNAGPLAEGQRRCSVDCWVVHSDRAQKEGTDGAAAVVEVFNPDIIQSEVASLEKPALVTENFGLRSVFVDPVISNLGLKLEVDLVNEDGFMSGPRGEFVDPILLCDLGHNLAHNKSKDDVGP